MSGSKLKQLWAKEYFQTALAIVLIIIIVFGFWFGLRYALNTDYPMLAVASGSMSTAQPDNTWQTVYYAFTPTLHMGDLIMVQAVKPQDIHGAPFSGSGTGGDILVFHLTGSDELIVHRAIEVFPNGTIKTQGDGNPIPGPPQDGNISPDQVVGKVVMRIPWVGYLALLMRDQAGIYFILALIIIIVAVELILSTTGEKKTEIPEDIIAANPPET